METPSGEKHDEKTGEESEDAHDLDDIEESKLVSGDRLRHLWHVLVVVTTVDHFP